MGLLPVARLCAVFMLFADTYMLPVERQYGMMISLQKFLQKFDFLKTKGFWQCNFCRKFSCAITNFQ
jgi:hypothetical protein